MAQFFIRRPIVAMVISIIITIVGVFTLTRLPIAEYPSISPTLIQVSSSYRGAAAEAVMDSVAIPIESQVNGVDKMLYMQSLSGNDGKMNLSVTFDVGTDVDIMQVNTQNRVSQAQAQLPDEVKREGVIVNRSSPDLLMVIGLFSPKGTYDAIFLGNYANINLVDAIKRVPGVGDVTNYTAQDYAMRIWVKPDKMAALGITPEEIAAAVREQNAQAPAGSIGSEPAPPGQETQYNVRTVGLLREADEFGNIVVRSNPDGSQVKIKDVARVELGAQTYDLRARLNQSPAAALGISLAPGANALKAAEQVVRILKESEKRFPPDMKYEITLDSTAPIVASMHKIQLTLIEAILLVLVVVFIFLQSLRATIIPMLAVPVSLLYLHRLSDAGFQRQYPDSIRHGVGDRYRCRRRHCGGGSGATSYRAWTQPARCNGASNEGGIRSGHCHCVDPMRRLRAGSVYERGNWAPLSAVCDYYCCLCHFFGDKRVNPKPGAQRDAVAKTGTGPGTARLVFRLVQSLV